MITRAALLGGCLLASSLAEARIPADLPADQLDWHPYAAQMGACWGEYLSPVLDLPEPHLPIDQARLFAEADQAGYSPTGGVDLLGQVRLRQGPLYLLADRAHLNAERTQAQLEGQLEVRQDNLLLRGERGLYQLSDEYLRLEQAHFVVHDQRLRGAAWQLEQLPDGRVVLHQSRLTTCAPDDQAWRVVAQRLVLNQETGFGDAWHVRMEIQRVPVFYWPYLRFPIDDRRHTGLLTPSLAYSSSSGLDLTQPIYWNLAPNYDLTFYPRYIEKRGSMWGLEARYLQSSDQGLLFYARLADDELAEQDRWHFSWQHRGEWPGQPLRYQLHLDQVSDGRYFEDLARGRFGEDEADDLLQQVRVDYRWQAWQLTANVQGYQKLSASRDAQYSLWDWRAGREAGKQDYFRLPQLEARTRMALGGGWQLNWLSELTRFDQLFDDQVSQPGRIHPTLRPLPGEPEGWYASNWGAARAWRLHLEPSVTQEWRWPWAYIRPRAAVRYNQYWLDPYWSEHQTSAQQAWVDTEPDMLVPLASLDMGLYLERQDSLLGWRYRQTLEPRLFAAYIPFVEQYQIPTAFDSALSEFDFNQLFRAERSTGRDRLADIQKVTLGVTQRLISQDAGREVGSLSLAREFYLDDRRIALSHLHPDEDQRFENLPVDERPYHQVRRASNYAAQLSWNITTAWRFNTQLLWDEQLGVTDRSASRLSYSRPEGHQLNFMHTYTSNYAQRLRGRHPTTEDLEDVWTYRDRAEEQYAVSGLYVLDEQWRFFAKLGYDWKRNERTESLAGFEYDSCCWQVQLVWRNWITNIDDTPAFDPEQEVFSGRNRDRGVFIRFEFKGLGGAGAGGSTRELLGTEIPGYTDRQ